MPRGQPNGILAGTDAGNVVRAAGYVHAFSQGIAQAESGAGGSGEVNLDGGGERAWRRGLERKRRGQRRGVDELRKFQQDCRQ
jgi:hypothetical protein